VVHGTKLRRLPKNTWPMAIIGMPPLTIISCTEHLHPSISLGHQPSDGRLLPAFMVLNIVNCDITVFFGMWNLDHLVTCGIPYANTYGIPRNSGKFYYKNTAEFRMFFKNFRIPSEVKNALPWTP
jgi:hypothetical protein